MVAAEVVPARRESSTCWLQTWQEDLWEERRAGAGGGEVRCTGEWVDLDVSKMAFTFLPSCSYKVLGELQANKINSY